MTGYLYDNGYKYVKRIKNIDEQTSVVFCDYSKIHKCGDSEKDVSINILSDIFSTYVQ